MAENKTNSTANLHRSSPPPLVTHQGDPEAVIKSEG